MFTSYIIDKVGLTILSLLINGSEVMLPDRLCGDITDDNYNSVLDRLAAVGYIYRTEKRIDIERTMSFLISSAGSAEHICEENNGKRYVFRCEKLIIIIEEDRLSPKKCRIIPIKDEEMLAEFYRECSDEEDLNGEE